jgi:hypothetical protein
MKQGIKPIILLGWLLSLREGHMFKKSLDDNTLKKTLQGQWP